jgi:hypothetical protein
MFQPKQNYVYDNLKDTSALGSLKAHNLLLTREQLYDLTITYKPSALLLPI